jgi:hypothetical protein
MDGRRKVRMCAKRECLCSAHRREQDCLAGLRPQAVTFDVNGVASLA